MTSLLARMFGRRGMYVVACDFSVQTLTTLDDAELEGISTFFGSIEPYTDEETDLWDAFAITRAPAVLREWSRRCLNNRGGSSHLEVFFAPDLDYRMHYHLSSQKWVRALKKVDKEMYGLHIEVLKGIDDHIKLAKHTGAAAWHVTTISLGPRMPYGFDPDEPMNIATKRATEQGITVVVAAGNEGALVRGNSLNPWSVAPWTISVGATTADGSRLLESSSRGVEGDPYMAPTVVAPGETHTLSPGLNHGEKVAIENIRRATPNSMNIAPIGGQAWILTKDAQGKIWMALHNDGKPSTALPLEEVLEKFRIHAGAQTTTEHGTSFAAEYVASICGMLAKAVIPLAKDLPLKERPRLLKGLLMDMAEPLAGTKPWEAGSGLVTTEIADVYSHALNSERIWRVLRSGADLQLPRCDRSA